MQGGKSVSDVVSVGPGKGGQVGAAGLHQVLDLADDIGIDERAKDRVEKTQVGRRVVQHAGQRAAAPIEKARRGIAPIGAVGLQPVQRGNHRRENARE